MKKFAVLVAIILSFALIGCADDSTTYVYKNQDELMGMLITKAVYKDDELRLYIDDLKGDYSITAFDTQFNVIQSDFDTKYSRGVYTIKGTDAGKISGLYMDGTVRYHLRYLDSQEYAILCETEATEIGWMTSGDEEKYYTYGERMEQKVKRDKAAAIQEENFSRIEGFWQCENDPNMYIKIYRDSEDCKYMEWKRTDKAGDYYVDQMSIAVVNAQDNGDEWSVELLDNPYWGRNESFAMSLDETKIIDHHFKEEDDIYNKVD